MQTLSTDRETIRRLVILFSIFSFIAILAGASRMWWGGWQMRTFGDILRWREALSMFVFAPALSVYFWLILRCIGRGHTHPAAQTLCILTVYFIACGMGMHDPLNRMQCAYPAAGTMLPSVRHTLAYLDDGLSHWIFWGGFVLGSWTIGVQQALSPFDRNISRGWAASLLGISGVLLFVMFTNLAFEYPHTREDCGVVLLAGIVPAVVAAVRFRSCGILRMPVLLVILPAYGGSVLLTYAYWLSKGCLPW